MLIRLITLCGCSREIDMPPPAGREINIPMMRSYRSWMEAEGDNMSTTAPYRVRQFDFYGERLGIREYIERWHQ